MHANFPRLGELFTRTGPCEKEKFALWHAIKPYWR